MGNVLILIYGIIAYAVGMGGLTFWFLWVGGWDFLPWHIDSYRAGPVGAALLTNTVIMALWSVQHSVMARDSFKRAWTKIIPPAAERSTYVLLSGVLMVVICWYWQALPGVAWHIENPTIATVLTTIHLAGWTIAVASSFLINHFELFGLQQVYLNLTGKPEPAPHFTVRAFYRFVRHPLQFGLIVGMWSAAYMSMTRLCLAAMMTVYIFIGLYFEEKTLVAHLGKDYEDYRNRVRPLLPIPK